MNSPSAKPRVAFFGLGLMGGGMASRLAGAGFPLAVYNRSPAKAAPLVAGGAALAATPAEAARDADVLISMVADDDASRGLWFGPNGALAAVKPGAIIIESSTVTPTWIQELSAAAQARGCGFLDAPVTGSKPQAAAGELQFIVGGDAAVLEKSRPVLAVMSRAIVHLGPIGSGALVKLINNFLCGVQAASLAEGLTLIERSGLDRAKALEVITGGAPGSPLLKTLSNRMTTQDYRPNFLLRLMAKDLAYTQKAATAYQLDSQTATAALSVFKKGIAAGDGDRDLSAVVEQFRKQP